MLNHKLLNIIIKHLLLLFFLLLTNSSYAETDSITLDHFIEKQKIIRIAADGGPGFGDQSASANVMTWLRNRGFKGTFEFIYSDARIETIRQLFDLPFESEDKVPDFYEDKERKIQFIKMTAFIKRRMDEALTPHVDLAMAGEYEDNPCSYISDYHLNVPNLAAIGCAQSNNRYRTAFFNVAAFAEVGVWTRKDETTYSFISTEKNAGKAVLYDVGGTFFTMPVANLNDAKSYLDRRPQGQALLKKIPALTTLIKGIENKDFNFMAAYGYTLRHYAGSYQGFPWNILEMITGARYAQMLGPKELYSQLNKPLIIAVFYDYTSEANDLDRIINHDDWGSYKKIPAAEQVVHDPKLSLTNAFFVASIADPDASDKIKNLKPGQMLLLSLGPLPKTVFDGIYTHTNDNIWPQIREGESSLNSLLLTGKPHLRCKNGWEISTDLISDSMLNSQMTMLYGEDGYFGGIGICNDENAWLNNSAIYQTIGQLIIEANKPDSAFSKYFKEIKQEASKPENDRIYQVMLQTMRQI